jgi:Tfp pilus assembly protein PilN
MIRALINLSPRPFRNDNLYRLIYISCLGVLALATFGNVVLILRHGWTLAALSGHLKVQREALADLEKRGKELGDSVAALNSGTLQKRADFANAAILNRVFSWTSLFNELETVVPPEVRLRSVRPAVGKQGKVDLTLEGTARDYGSFVELEESLMQSPAFGRVYPGSERLQNPAYRAAAPALPLGPGRPAPAPAAPPGGGEVGFILSCEYFPGARLKAEAAPGGAGR